MNQFAILWPTLANTFILGFLILVVGITVNHLCKKPNLKLNRKQHKRRMSSFSEILSNGSGTYPDKYGVPTMTVHGILALEDLPSRQELISLLQEKLLPQHRFSSHVYRDPMSPGALYYKKCDTVDLEGHHVKDVQASSEEEILSYIESCFTRDWETDVKENRPLWYVHRIVNTGTEKVNFPVLTGRYTPRSSVYLNQLAGTGESPLRKQASVILIEIHHGMGDGMSILDILKSLVTGPDGKPLPTMSKKYQTKSKNQKPSATTSSVMSLVKSVVPKLFIPFFMIQAAFKVLLSSQLWPDSKTALKRQGLNFHYSGNRKIFTVPPLSLSLIKVIKDRLGVTVNDVMLGLFAGAFRRYMIHRSDPLLKNKNLQMRCMIPYSFERKGLDSDDIMRNRWTGISVQLPVGLASGGISRILAAKKYVDHLKWSLEPIVASFLQDLSYYLLGYEATVDVMAEFVKRQTCVFTNVPGFLSTSYLCGRRVLAMHPFISNAIPQFSLVSNENGVYLNYVLDPNVVVEPSRIGEFLVLELENVAKELGLEEYYGNVLDQ